MTRPLSLCSCPPPQAQPHATPSPSPASVSTPSCPVSLKTSGFSPSQSNLRLAARAPPPASASAGPRSARGPSGPSLPSPRDRRPPGPILSPVVSLLLVSTFHEKAGMVPIPTLPFAPQHPASESSSNHAVCTALAPSTRVLAAEASGAPASAGLTSLGSWTLQSSSPLLARGQHLQS